MPVKTAPELRLILSSTAVFAPLNPYFAQTSPFSLPMRAIPQSSLSNFGFFRAIAFPDHTYLRPLPGSLRLPPPLRRRRSSPFRSAFYSSHSSSSREVLDAADFPDSDKEGIGFQENGGLPSGNDAERFDAPRLKVKELEEIPEQWRRSKLAWLCKELPTHKHGTLVRILNAQRKWLRQEEATYVAVHCMRIREHETGFKVYQWMMRQSWCQFDFALATKLADYMGREGKFAKCQEIFDYIIKHGQVPSESTFHNLIVAYLDAPVQGCLDEACNIYNQMIQLGVHLCRFDLHNLLFSALVSNPGGSSKHYLKQAEFIFFNLVKSGLEVPKEIYSGLIYMHSNQDTVDKTRIIELRDEMRKAGFEEGKEVLVSVLRACAKEGDVEEAETTWIKLCASESIVPSETYVYRMEIYAKLGEFMKSLEVFREMEKNLGSASVAAYQKIIEMLCKAQDVELAESLMKDFTESGKKPLLPSYVDLTSMYLDLSLHDKQELAFSECLEKCQPNGAIYNNYLTSLVRVGNLGKAEEIFNHMHADGTIGINSQSCNTILSGYLSSGDFVKAKRIYDLMCQKRYDIDSGFIEKLDSVLSLSRKMVKEPLRLKLSKEQREILVGLLLGGLQVISDEQWRNHFVQFEFNQNSVAHSVFRRHVHDQFHEWLHRSSKSVEEDIPYKFNTISHPYFSFYANQFWLGGKPKIPKLIHRWLSPKVLAYWFMYGGYRTSSGGIILKIKGNHEDIEKIVETFREKSVECKVKRKGRVFWIGFLGHNSTLFWKLIEPHILNELKNCLNAEI